MVSSFSGRDESIWKGTISVCITTGSLFVWAIGTVFFSVAHKSQWNAFTTCHAFEFLWAACWRCCHREQNKCRVYTWRIVLVYLSVSMQFLFFFFRVWVDFLEPLGFYIDVMLYHLCFLWQVIILTTVQFIWIICAVFSSITSPGYVNALSTVALKLTTAAASYAKHTPRQKQAIITIHRFMGIMCLCPVKVFVEKFNMV